ncbi:decarboxylase [Candidatus Woesearchaeota archaeon]|nr:decarboxylase [Candidatus Woesearchaeota archaeon]
MLSKARFVLSKSKLIKQYKKSLELADIVSYSYKTNPIIGVHLEKETPCMFSVHSVESVLQLKFSERIWFFAQALSLRELDLLFKENVFRFVVDNISDLNILLRYCKRKNKKIEVLLRMKLKEYTIHTGKHFVYGMYSSKINKIIPELKKNPQVIKLGIHFHRKTQNTSEWSLKKEFCDALSIRNLKNLDYVNIGGGIPAIYKNYSPKILENIFVKIKKFNEFLSSNNITMIIEPGRFIAASPIILEADIVSIYKKNIIINCSVFNSAMDTFIANHRLVVKGELDSGEKYTIKGCTPDSMDIFRYSVYLNNPKINDKIIFLNAGAYNFSCDFCNLAKLETVIVD